MTCVGENDLASGGENHAEARDKAPVLRTQQNVVEALQGSRRRDLFVGNGTESAHGNSAEHGSLQALPAHVPDGDEDGAVGPWQNLAEIAAHFLRGAVSN